MSLDEVHQMKTTRNTLVVKVGATYLLLQDREHKASPGPWMSGHQRLERDLPQSWSLCRRILKRAWDKWGSALKW